MLIHTLNHIMNNTITVSFSPAQLQKICSESSTLRAILNPSPEVPTRPQSIKEAVDAMQTLYNKGEKIQAIKYWRDSLSVTQRLTIASDTYSKFYADPIYFNDGFDKRSLAGSKAFVEKYLMTIRL